MLLSDSEECHQLTDRLMDEIVKRFDLLSEGEVTRNRHGWPLVWSGRWPVEERAQFLKAISRFSSNFAPFFGRLLTPLVNGVRVAGPFSPAWMNGQRPKLVLLDGEGLGHTPKSSSISTAVSRRIGSADAVVFVDNATQPMQAAAFAAMREIVMTGNARKLIMVFTHFDEVKGDNLPTTNEKAQHVMAAAENVSAAFGEDLHPAKCALRGGTRKTAVIGAVERSGKVVAEVADDLSGKGVLAFIKRAIDPDAATLVTDEYQGYNVVRRIMDHCVIQHSERYADGGIHTNTIEGVWSLLKRAWYGSHHHYTRHYTPLYVAEASYKYNHRKDDNAFADRFDSYCREKGYKKSPLIARLVREYLNRETSNPQPDLFDGDQRESEGL